MQKVVQAWDAARNRLLCALPLAESERSLLYTMQNGSTAEMGLVILWNNGSAVGCCCVTIGKIVRPVTRLIQELDGY
jgi:hypothetical protein